MNTERLLKLADLMDKVQADADLRKHFSLVDWLSESDVIIPENDTILVPHNCGATACACGYAGLDPWFRAQGFKTTEAGGIEYKDHLGWSAPRAFFDLSRHEAEYLFDMYCYPVNDYAECIAEPKDVAERIRAFVTSDGALPTETLDV